MTIRSWLSKTFGLETRAATLSTPDTALYAIFGAATSIAGVTVSPTTAMRSPAVRRAVGSIAETTGTLPCIVYERDASGGHKPAESHPAYALLSRDANPWTPAPRLIEQIVRDACLHGNGYAFVNRANGEPRELIRLRPDGVQVQYDTVTGEPAYTLVNEQQRTVDRADIIHLQAPSVDGVIGESPVTSCREAIVLNITLQEHVSRLFARGARPSGILKFPNALGDKAAAKLQASWQAAHGGQNSGGTAVIEEGGEYQFLALSSADAQTLELWTFSVNEIARAFGVPPHLLFELGRATWGNAGEMGASFLRFTLARWLTALEGELALKLIAPEERDRFTIEFDTDLLLRADLAARADAYGKLIAARVINPNEARAWENLPPYEGGNVFLNPNTTPNAGAANGK